ncbi:MAG: NADP oxidoreductase, partial [Candidatus Tectomicrobia bacterium]|nr:NADP oxidoreductase [Candidatus Tectomicrobia bacterium]
EEAALDELSRTALEASQDRGTSRKVEMIQAYAGRASAGKPRKLSLRFLVSPVELVGNAAGEVAGMRLVRNQLYATDDGSLRPRATDEFEEFPVGLVFRSVGYLGVPLPGVPFREDWGVILNEKGRVLASDTSTPLPGEYTSGWIKRGPSGVIGTNKPDALETVQCMLEDVVQGRVLTPAHPDPAEAEQRIRDRQPQYVSFEDWLRLDALEVEQGQASGRPRVKFTRVEEMLEALEKTPAA